MRIADLEDVLPDTYSHADRELIQRAYRVATGAHKGQRRASGEPYVNHSLAVAQILAEMHVPPSVVAAGLLHDTVEDTSITLKDLGRDFGEEISSLVDGVTKLTQLPRVSRGDQHAEEDQKEQNERDLLQRRGKPDPEKEAEANIRHRGYDLASETLRKTFLAMSEDIRVVLIKLADRLHNMRTLRYVAEEKQRRIAQQTLDIFAPLASRLGIWQFKWELEDLGFRYVNSETYKEIANKLAERRSEREQEVENIVAHLEKVLGSAGIMADITGRPKHIYSIYRKMKRKDVPFERVHDIRGVRVEVPDVPSCYAALGIIHTQWRPIHGEFDDYIAVPKDNFYQSLHTAVVYDDKKTLEVQIRTPEMHQNAEFGIAAHWRYKEGKHRDGNFDRRVQYLRQLMEWQQDVVDADDFVDGMKTDVFGDRVYAFTPRGDIIDMPAGSTPIDFAYHVHTEIGHRCRGAKINGKLTSLNYTLSTGDQVEILTAKRGGPSRDWLNPNLEMVKTQRTKAKIRQWFKRQARDQNIIQGKSLLEKELRRLGIADVKMEDLIKEFGYRTVDDFHMAVGCGDLPLGRIVNFLTFTEEDADDLTSLIKVDDLATKQISDSVAIMGLKGLLSVPGKCCNPAPGDDIIGYITRGRGATIHRQDCPNVLRVRDRERLVKVSWGERKSTHSVPIKIQAYDRDGLMKDVSTVISDEDINMAEVKVDVNGHIAVFDLVLQVQDITQLSRVLIRLENLPNVMEARRVRPG